MESFNVAKNMSLLDALVEYKRLSDYKTIAGSDRKFLIIKNRLGRYDVIEKVSTLRHIFLTLLRMAPYKASEAKMAISDIKAISLDQIENHTANYTDSVRAYYLGEVTAAIVSLNRKKNLQVDSLISRLRPLIFDNLYPEGYVRTAPDEDAFYQHYDTSEVPFLGDPANTKANPDTSHHVVNKTAFEKEVESSDVTIKSPSISSKVIATSALNCSSESSINIMNFLLGNK